MSENAWGAEKPKHSLSATKFFPISGANKAKEKQKTLAQDETVCL
jgi:hypothetical protein